MAGILIVFGFFVFCFTLDMKIHATNVISVCLLCMDTIYERGVSIQCLVLWWCLTKEQEPFMRALQNVLHCPILFPCETLVPVCLQRNGIFLLSFWRQWIVFGELVSLASPFLPNSMLKEEIHFKSSATGPGFVKMLFFPSTGMNPPGSFAFVTLNIWPVTIRTVPRCAVDLGSA